MSPVRNLRSFSGTLTPTVGEAKLQCQVNGVSETITFVVVKDNLTPILGRKTCQQLNLIRRVEETTPFVTVPEEMFNGIGCIKNFEYDMELIPNAVLKIHPPRSIPYAIRDDVKTEIDKMVTLGIMEPVSEPTPVASPLVVVKQNGKLRVCMDPSDLNKAVKRQHFPLKSVEDISARIQKAKFFSILDARKGFWQIRVTKNTSKYLTVNTPWGRYRFLRLPFGLASAPEVFQQCMSTILQGIENVECAMDDILIFADTLEELREITSRVIARLRAAGVKLNKEKCLLEQTEIKFLGHIFTPNGVKIDPSKVEAIEKLRTPGNVAELQRLLGMVNYLAKFLPNHSLITEPLRRLLVKNVLWEWSQDQEEAFEKIKEGLKAATTLAFNDVNKPVILSVDASSYAVGAVLLQEGRPVAYATKALNSTQQAYPQIEKEAFAIRFGCSRFHDYIYGKDLTIETDHKPLESIAKKSLSSAPPRLQRLLFDIMPYGPRIVYVKGSDIPVADTLSRDCLQTDEINEDRDHLEIPLEVPLAGMSVAEVQDATRQDPELQELSKIVLDGWPDVQSNLSPAMQQYWTFRDELTVYEGLVFKNLKLVVPKAIRRDFLQLIHLGHLGQQASLSRARDCVFWLGLTRDVINLVESCSVCQSTQRCNQREPMIMKPVPIRPWQRVASDILECRGKPYLLIVDSYSGWFDFVELENTTSEAVISKLKRWFSVFGIPDVLECDNGVQYVSRQFQNFQTTWKFKVQTSSPRYPQSNGLAERYVQTAKNMLKKCQKDDTDLMMALLNWRNTPRGELGTPSQSLIGRCTRTLIPVHPTRYKQTLDSKNIPETLRTIRFTQKSYADARTAERKDLHPGDRVRLQIAPRQWVRAAVEKPADSPRSFVVNTDSGRSYRRNTFHLAPTKATLNTDKEVVCNLPTGETKDIVNKQTDKSTFERVCSPPPFTFVTRSGRMVKPPQRLNL